MTRYEIEKWMRWGLAGTAFAMALLLTPRALLDVSGPADSHEIPVDMLEPSDDCLWCTPPADFEEVECDDADGTDQHWLNPDQIRPQDLNAPCRDDVPSEEPSA